jgi:rare lipoprotein A
MVGVASWYGYPYHGRKAADGRRYDMNRLTAAHRTLRLGTRVRVYNLLNARTVEVKITDRGPFVEGRIIDLSRAAARVLGFQRAGLTPVRLEILSETTKPGASD